MRDPQNFFTRDEITEVWKMVNEGAGLVALENINSKIREAVGQRVTAVTPGNLALWSNQPSIKMDTHEAHLFCVREIK